MKIKQVLVNITCWFVFGLVGSQSHFVWAETHYHTSIGGGVETRNAGDPGFLFKVEFIHNFEHEQVPQIEPLFYVGRLGGELSYAGPNVTKRVPYYDFRFGLAGVKLQDHETEASGEIFPLILRKDFGVGDRTILRVSAFRVDAQVPFPFFYKKGKRALFAKLMVDALGYKMASFAERENFSGVNLGELGAEVGAAFYPWEEFAVKLVFGAKADLAYNGVFQSDRQAYTAIRIEPAQVYKIFLQASSLSSSQSKMPTLTGSQILAGMTFLF